MKGGCNGRERDGDGNDSKVSGFKKGLYVAQNFMHLEIRKKSSHKRRIKKTYIYSRSSSNGSSIESDTTPAMCREKFKKRRSKKFSSEFASEKYIATEDAHDGNEVSSQSLLPK